MPSRDPTNVARVDEVVDASRPASDSPPAAPPPPMSPSIENGEILVRRLLGDHANLIGLALVLESLLARVHDGEAVDRRLLADIVDYMRDYLERVHAGRERTCFAAIAAPIPAASDVALEGLRDEIARQDVTADEIVRKGFVCTRALRRRIALEDSLIVRLARTASRERADCDFDGDDPQLEEHYRARFDAITHRVGCGCAFEKD